MTGNQSAWGAPRKSLRLHTNGAGVAKLRATQSAGMSRDRWASRSRRSGSAPHARGCSGPSQGRARTAPTSPRAPPGRLTFGTATARCGRPPRAGRPGVSVCLCHVFSTTRLMLPPRRLDSFVQVSVQVDGADRWPALGCAITLRRRPGFRRRLGRGLPGRVPDPSRRPTHLLQISPCPPSQTERSIPASRRTASRRALPASGIMYLDARCRTFPLLPLSTSSLP